MQDGTGYAASGQTGNGQPQAPLFTKVVPPLAIEVIGDPTELFGALATAQGKFKPLIKNRTVTVTPKESRPYTFDYATLDAVFDSVREALAANGLAILQPFSKSVGEKESVGELQTWLCHASGARLVAKCELIIPPKIQELGSALTYLKRYSVASLLGISSEEDDDGNAADGNQREAQDRGKPPPAPQQATKGSGGGKATQGKPAGKAAPQAGQEGQRRPEPSPESAPAGGLAQRAPVDVGTAVAGAMAAAEKAREDHPDPDTVRKSEPPPANDAPEMRDETYYEIIETARAVWPNSPEARKENLAAMCFRITGLEPGVFKDKGTEPQAQEFLAELKKMRPAEAG
jgi:hypothetical protein